MLDLRRHIKIKQHISPPQLTCPEVLDAFVPEGAADGVVGAVVTVVVVGRMVVEAGTFSRTLLPIKVEF